MSKHHITIIGSLNTDLVTTTPRVPIGGETLTASSFSTGSGGKGANQAVACARLSRQKPMAGSTPSSADVDVKMIGAVGDDKFGPGMVDEMKSNGIDTSSIKIVRGETTGVAVIIVEEKSGENRILLNPGANHTLLPDTFLTAESFGNPKPDLLILQLEIPIDTVKGILQTASEAQIPVLLNPAPAVALDWKDLSRVDHLILNESEADILSAGSTRGILENETDYQNMCDWFLDHGVKHVVITLGEKGAYFSMEAGKGNLVEAEKDINVVDTTAAGDTFVGGYAVAVVRAAESVRGDTKVKESAGWEMEAAVRWASKAAARTVEKKGAQSAIPWADEV